MLKELLVNLPIGAILVSRGFSVWNIIYKDENGRVIGRFIRRWE